MVKVKRISPEEDVTLEITAPKELWAILTNLAGKITKPSGGCNHRLYDGLHKQFRDRDESDFGGVRVEGR